MIKKNKKYIENNNRLNVETLEFREKTKYIINKFIDLENNNIFKNDGVYNNLENIGIKIITLREDKWFVKDYDNFELKVMKCINSIIIFSLNDCLTNFYLDRDFSIKINKDMLVDDHYDFQKCIYQESKSKFHVVNDDNIYIYQYIINYIEKIYKKLKENEEIEKELNKVETTQRKRVKI